MTTDGLRDDDTRSLPRRRVLGLLATGAFGAFGGCGSRSDESPPRSTTTDSAQSTATGTTGDETTDGTADATASRERALTIEAPDAWFQDERVVLRVTGAAPGERVTVEATMVDYVGSEWTSTATFEADDAGVVDLAEQAPVEGTYDRADAMGWLWSMSNPRAGRPFFHNYSVTERTADVVARTNGGATDRSLTLRLADPDVEETEVRTDDLAGVLYEPTGDGPAPGVLALHGSGSILTRRRAKLLAANGYATLALRYFGNPAAVPDRHDSVPLSYFDGAQSWLRERDAVRDASVGVAGVSRGGELALLLGARRDWVGAVVSWVGSGVGWEGGSGNPPNPAWTDDGDPVPALTWAGSVPTNDEGNYRFLDVATRRLDAVSDERLREATFAVEDTDAPLLLLSAGDDLVWPSRRLSELAVERLRTNDVSFDYEHLTYDDAGHFVSVPYTPTTNRTVMDGQVLGGTAAGYATAEAESWPVVLSFLEQGLDP